MQSHPSCDSDKLEVIFCKHYWKVFKNEQVYMVHFMSSSKSWTLIWMNSKISKLYAT